MKNLSFFSGLICVFLGLSSSALAVDMGQVERDLSGPGVVGWVHGAVVSREMYAFTYRNPSNFFDFVVMSLIPTTPDLGVKLATLGRNDQVRIRGTFMDNPSPQKHIMMTSVDLMTKYTGLAGAEAYRYSVKLPDDLERLNRGVFLVHAVGGDGQILVVEYKDQVIPIFVQNPKLTEGLSRNDLVRLRFELQKKPNQPTHLVLQEAAPDAVEVLQSIAKLNGQPATAVTGTLIMFPKSPEILFNVFAVQDESPALRGYQRQFTIVNQEDPAVFAKIRKMLQDAWDRHPYQFVNGRNKLVSTKIRVTVTGTYNEIDPGQANAQILLKSADDLKILEDNSPAAQLPAL